jgi:hypothetical protein
MHMTRLGFETITYQNTNTDGKKKHRLPNGL